MMKCLFSHTLVVVAILFTAIHVMLTSTCDINIHVYHIESCVNLYIHIHQCGTNKEQNENNAHLCLMLISLAPITNRPLAYC